MFTHRKHFVALVSLVFLSGCIAIDDPKNYQPSTSSPGTGLVCFYRTAPRTTPGAWQDWVLDGKWSGKIRPDDYSCGYTHVGQHIVRVGVSENKLEFMLEKDKQVFIRFDVDDNLFGKGIYPVLVDNQTAQEEFAKLGYKIESTNPK